MRDRILNAVSRVSVWWKTDALNIPARSLDKANDSRRCLGIMESVMARVTNAGATAAVQGNLSVDTAASAILILHDRVDALRLGIADENGQLYFCQRDNGQPEISLGAPDTWLNTFETDLLTPFVCDGCSSVDGGC